MAAEVDSDWSTNSNEALTISLVAGEAGKLTTLTSFKPKFTYALFGDEESIFGYKGLKINLRYHACDMRPNLQINWDKKFKAVNETAAQDLEPIFKEFLPEVAFKKSAEFEAILNSEEQRFEEWTPPGFKIRTFDDGDSHFEVWCASLGGRAGPQTQQTLKRIQVLIPFFIDGGTFIEDETHKRWTLFFIYKVKKNVPSNRSPYVFMGYASTYRYYIIHNINKYAKLQSKDGKRKRKPLLDWKLPLQDPEQFNCRSRISQFVILPPFQKSGHGARLYNSIYSHYLKKSNVVELTVEDPNEEFDVLRDMNDLAYLRTRADFRQIFIDPAVKINKKGIVPIKTMLDLKNIEDIRVATKIAPRQFDRLVEMHLLSKIPPHIRQSRVFIPAKEKEVKSGEEEQKQKHVYHLWQLLVKCRLHRHNRDTLMQVDRPERADKLEAAAASVEEGYAKLLLALDRQEARSKKAEVTQEAEGAVADEIEEGETAKGKEKRAAEEAEVGDEPTAKKAKLDNSKPTNGNADKGGDVAGEKTDDVEMEDTPV